VLLPKYKSSRYLTAKNLQRLFTVAVLAGFLLLLGVFLLNYTTLQRPLNRVVARDSRNTGVQVTVYYASYMDMRTIVFDVRGMAPPAGAPGVLRSFMQFAHELQGRRISEVIIAVRGQRKFKIHGDDFLTLGASVGTAQPRQLLWELAHNLRFLNNKLVLSHLPGDYAALLKKSLGEGAETATADQLLQTITH